MQGIWISLLIVCRVEAFTGSILLEGVNKTSHIPVERTGRYYSKITVSERHSDDNTKQTGVDEIQSNSYTRSNSYDSTRFHHQVRVIDKESSRQHTVKKGSGEIDATHEDVSTTNIGKSGIDEKHGDELSSDDINIELDQKNNDTMSNENIQTMSNVDNPHHRNTNSNKHEHSLDRIEETRVLDGVKQHDSETVNNGKESVDSRNPFQDSVGFHTETSRPHDSVTIASHNNSTSSTHITNTRHKAHGSVTIASDNNSTSSTHITNTRHKAHTKTTHHRPHRNRHHHIKKVTSNNQTLESDNKTHAFPNNDTNADRLKHFERNFHNSGDVEEDDDGVSEQQEKRHNNRQSHVEKEIDTHKHRHGESKKNGHKETSRHGSKHKHRRKEQRQHGFGQNRHKKVKTHDSNQPYALESYSSVATQFTIEISILLVCLTIAMHCIV